MSNGNCTSGILFVLVFLYLCEVQWRCVGNVIGYANIT